jgi:hypothetical protein
MCIAPVTLLKTFIISKVLVHLETKINASLNLVFYNPNIIFPFLVSVLGISSIKKSLYALRQ